MTANTTLLSLSEIESLAAACLMANGCDEINAGAVSRVIAAAERDGCHAHGLMRLPGYVAALRSGKVNGHARPTVHSQSAAVLRVDGDRGYAPLALELGTQSLGGAAKQAGIAALALVNTHHFAALWYEIEMMAAQGLVAMACTSYKPAVLPAGGTRALYGTNPLAFGWPRSGGQPVVFDQASAVMARGEVMLAASEGRTLPEGVGVDPQGQPTTDPQAVLKGALLAFGGYKGSSIAMMVELLAGALIGECFSFEAASRDNEDGGPPRGGEFMLAIDPAHLGDGDGWQSHAELLFGEICAQQGTRLPGERRYRHRAVALQEGVAVSTGLLEKVRALAG
ncbi:MAG: Ldh family oxidoreductase [Xanthomonadales bacterium]|nr:Ldh family oxidoreductase [Xanthomonadales bacterium]NIN58394.1 Ldh family oxidoreductase [Xanthomonadales bacterium]NIN73731.1 Ldh family oxidoreductase [Xanthomonadales bacterium]NIO14529.1 Ldh family oxidoreductase [Xanthomonadales bacterium]NIP10787.1 Ldh family oxidoreductase [Xanthomonadales bacterium]